ncbi:MAG: carbohydrate kinase family protein [Anaerolineae bacterium]|nr:carbohydrate kinase family protein [Anaerolineae bacterium]
MHILVAGLINIETTLRIEAFPVPYQSQHFPFFGIQSSVSGVGYNVCRALTVLGHRVSFLALIGQDAGGQLVRHALADMGVAADHVLPLLEHTPQSVILYDAAGRRASYTDLKNIQDAAYPAAALTALLPTVDLAVLCNINFARPLLAQVQAAGIPLATDVHAIADLDDAYNRDFMAAADILFQSHERLPVPPADWLRQLQARYDPAVAVVGMGQAGALLAVRGAPLYQVPAVTTRPVVNTIGAGDALFSAFLHTYGAGGAADLALHKAAVFASYKIGVAGAADGFLDAAGLEAWYTLARQPG